ncbi:MAG: bifunctional 4-hydroxy-3-methylbut-2-enyl diphosphate reductase/30S ribosomal protein S1 [Tepidanaerobacteraceae bacterium]|jgi:small subunit ribosomal protein S1
MSEHAGFCFGVKKAFEATDNLIRKGIKAYTLGPIVHNPQVVNKLIEQGILPSKLKNIDSGTVIIRTHGVGPSIIEHARLKGLNIIDATCPFVKKVHKIAKQMSDNGYLVIIIGDPHHPEVEGIKSWCNGDVKIIETVKDAENFFTNRQVGIVVQTTQTQENIDKIMQILKAKLDIKLFENTRCHATQLRQDAAKDLAKKVDTMLVIGGKNSANTKKLAQICQNVGARVYHIEKASEINREWFDKHDKVGITAGASTPDWIIKEVILRMDEINKEENKQEVDNSKEEADVSYEETFADIQEDTIVKGTVVKVSNNEVIVNIGYKSDGIIPLNEISYTPVQDPCDYVKVGDEIDVYVLKLEDKEGNLILSKKRADTAIALDKIENAYKENSIVEGTVTEIVKGGVIADVYGIKGFIPASHLDLKYVPDLNVYTGKTLKLKVIELDKNKNRIVLSRKTVMEEEKQVLREKTWASIEEGQLIKGTVRRLTDFGAFVDIGGVDGLIHISDLAWQKINHPSEVVKEDEEVEVNILKIDRERERISLGLKQVLGNPWDEVENKYEIGSIVDGKVVKLVTFGAFVEIEPGVEGLVHISQISNEHIPTPGDVLNVDDIVKVKIMDINAKERKMSLSIKEALREKNEKRNEMYMKSSDNGITIGEMVGEVFDKNINEE